MMGLLRALILTALLSTIPSAAAQDAAAQSPALPAAENCAKLQGVFVDLESTPQGYVLPVTLNGAEHKFLLDLSQPHSIIDETLATAMKLEAKSMPKSNAVFFAMQMLSRYSVVPSAVFAGMRFPPTEFALWKKGQKPPMMPNVPDEALTLGVDGVIGMNVLSGIDFELDLKNGKLGLFAPYHCPFVPDWHTGDVGAASFEFTPLRTVVISATLDDKPVQVAFSSTRKENSMASTVAYRQLGIDSATEGLNELPRLLGTPRHRARFKSLQASGLNIGNLDVAIYGRLGVSCENSKSPRYDAQLCMLPVSGDLMLGTDTLSRLHLYFSTVSKTLYFGAARSGAE